MRLTVTPAQSVVAAPTAADPAPDAAIAAQAAMPALPATAAQVGLVVSGLNRLSGDDPSAPAQLPGSWTVLAAARRQVGQRPAATAHDSANPFFSFFFNQTPTLSPVQTGQSAGGVVTGVLNADDADGDALTVSVSQMPAAGTAELNPDGTYTYTPYSSGSPGMGISDSFAVTVSDAGSGFHIHGLMGLLNLLTFGLLGDSGHTSTATVEVTASTAGNHPPVASVTVGSPDPTTGVVNGIVNASDPDNDPLTYSAPIGTSKGAVVINAGTGAFTYTPTATARQNAAKPDAADADKSDSFTVTVSDGYGGSAAASVTVAIAPAGSNPTNSDPVAARPYVTEPDASSAVVTGQVLASDPDADPLSYRLSVPATKGTVTVNADGTFTYTPTPTARADVSATAVVGDIRLSGTPRGIAVSPDGTFAMVTLGSSGITMVDAAGNRYATANVPQGSAESIAIASDGMAYAVLQSPTTGGLTGVVVIDTASNAVTATIGITGVNYAGGGIAVSPDARHTYVAAETGVLVIDNVTQSVSTTITLWVNPDDLSQSGPGGLAINPDGTRLYAVDAWRLAAIDLSTNIVTSNQLISPAGSAGGPAVSPDGRRLYTLNYGGSQYDNSGAVGVSTFDATTNAATGFIPVLGRVGDERFLYGITLSPDGSRVYASNWNSVSVADTASNAALATLVRDNWSAIWSMGSGWSATPGTVSTHLYVGYQGNDRTVDGFARSYSAVSMIDFGPATIQAMTDSFTVTVSDGRGGAVAIPVTVSIAPSSGIRIVT